MRKIVVMLLALMIAMSMTATVFAAETGSTEQTASATVVDTDDEEISEPEDEEEISDVDEEETPESGKDEGDLLPAVAPGTVTGANPDTGVSPLLKVSVAAGLVSLAVLVTLSYKGKK